MARFTATHGNKDVGVWVCEGCGVIIGPRLFTKASCPDEYPTNVSIKWHEFADNKFKSYDETLPLLWGDCGQIQPTQSYLHLFSIGEAATGAFEAECVLSDLQFPVRMAGFVVLFERASVEHLDSDEVGSAKRFSESTLNWVKKHKLPYVIAATGYDFPQFSVDEFRNHFALEPDVPVVVGPSVKTKNIPVFDSEFGSEYVAQVLSILSEQIERKGF